MIEHTEARYEVQDVEMDEVYTWRPKSVVVECDCGERPTLTASKTTCGRCGADHKAVAQEWLDVGRLGDEAVHPWRSAEDRGDDGLPTKRVPNLSDSRSDDYWAKTYSGPWSLVVLR